MIINVVNESSTVTTIELMTIEGALSSFANQVIAAWQLSPMTTVCSGRRVAGEWNVCIVDHFPNPAMTATALGYHEVVNGFPIAYIRANAYGSRSPFGRYIKPITFLGKQLTKATYSPGVATVAMHELAEMLIDPTIDRYKTDSKGRNWLMEVCDHTVGSYAINYAGTNVVAPDFTLPSFYDVKAKQPYSLLNVPPMPFYLVPGAYAYYKDATGTHKVV